MTLTSPDPTVPSGADPGLFDDPPVPTRRIPYSPALDGFRGVAVAAVVAYHGGLSWATGGYLGVDAFFVLSGYLITSLLLAEWAGTGRIALVAFWTRRARRLLPALFIFLVGMALFCLFLAKPDVLDQLRGDGISTLFYVMNWRLVSGSQSYFDQFYASPFRHMWSLAIEEQYYVVWPLVTAAVLHWRKTPKAMLVLCLGLAGASAAWMFVSYNPDIDPSRLYYGTDTRAQSLLIGSALAAAVASGLEIRSSRARLGLLVAAAGAIVVLAFHWVTLSATDPRLYRGGFLVFATCVAVIVVACTQVGDNPIRTAFSFEPLRRLGLISYGVYLYHWPLFAWINSERTGLSPTSLRLLAIRLIVTIGLAVASYFLLEKPIREGALKQLGVSPLIRSMLLPLSTALVLILLLTSTANAQRTTATPADFDPAKRPPPAAAAGADSKVLLVGDSVAYTLGVGFEGPAASDNHIAVWNQAVLFCELVKGAHRENGEIRPASDTCVNWDADWRSNVETFKPAATVLQIGAWEIFDREIDGTWIEFGTPEYDKILRPVLQRAVEALSSQGAPVIVLTTPNFVRNDGTSAKEWTQNDTSRTDHFNALLREVVAHNPTKTVLVDLGNYLCPANQCRESIDGVRIRPDGLHFKEEDARVVARWLAPQFRDIAVNGIPASTTGTTGAPGTTVAAPGSTATTTAAPPTTAAPETTTTAEPATTVATTEPVPVTPTIGEATP